MKMNLIKTLLILAVSFLISSCVSASKYDAMVFWKDSLQTANDSLENVLSAKNSNISELNNALANLKNQIARLQKELISTKDNYEKLKSQASSETGDLLSAIEILQKEKLDLETKLDAINQKLKAREDKMNQLRDKLSKALLGFADKGLTVSIKNGKVYVSLSNQLLFNSGSTEIDKKGQEALLELANVLNQQVDINVLIEGHTDNQMVRPGQKFADNWDLSVLRATEVTRYLTEKGSVDSKRIISSGRSEFYPVETGDTPEVRAKNRRTEIILTPKLEEIYELIGE